MTLTELMMMGSEKDASLTDTKVVSGFRRPFSHLKSNRKGPVKVTFLLATAVGINHADMRRINVGTLKDLVWEGI